MLEVLQAEETSFTGESVLDEIYPNELLISVVCVTLNAAGTLPDLINSIREQKTILMEFVVVDGGSKDDTIEILKAKATRPGHTGAILAASPENQ